MSDYRRQSNTKPADFSADVIRGFLLGRLSSTEQAKFEQRLLVDDELDERLRLAELELADEFASERMDRIDRQRFLKTFILTDERRRVLTVSTALRERFSAETISHIGSLPTSSWRRFFDFNQAAWRFAFGVLILFVLLASAWVVIKQPQIVRDVLPKRKPFRPAATLSPEPAHHPPNSAPPAHRETASPLPAHESTPPNAGVTAAAQTMVLSPATEISDSTTLSLPASVNDLVQFHLMLEGDRQGSFRAEIQTPEHQSVFTAEAVKRESAAIEFKVPASALRSGDYQIRLTEANEGAREVARYYFRVK